MNAGDDTDDTDDMPLIGSFGSYSPQYRKHNSSLVQINFPQQYLDESINTSGGSGCGSPTPSLISQSSNSSQNNTSVANTSAASTISRVIHTPQLRKLDVRIDRPVPGADSVANGFSFRLLGLPFGSNETALNARH